MLTTENSVILNLIAISQHYRTFLSFFFFFFFFQVSIRHSLKCIKEPAHVNIPDVNCIHSYSLAWHHAIFSLNFAQHRYNASSDRYQWICVKLDVKFAKMKSVKVRLEWKTGKWRLRIRYQRYYQRFLLLFIHIWPLQQEDIVH